MEVKHIVLHAVYLHFKDKIKEKALCVTKFTNVFLKKIRYMLLCVSVFSNFGCQKNVSAVCFPSMFCSIWEFKKGYSKKPASVTRKDILLHSNQLIYISL